MFACRDTADWRGFKIQPIGTYWSDGQRLKQNAGTLEYDFY